MVQSDIATEPQVATFKTAGGRWLLKGVERLEHAFRSAVEEALYELFTQSVRADSLPMQFTHVIFRPRGFDSLLQKRVTVLEYLGTAVLQ